jgi:hypothetical protein
LSVLNNSNAISAGGAYNITDSLRFRSSASAYLTRTPTTAGNRKTFTFSFWIKLGNITSSQQILYSSYSSDTVRDNIIMNQGNAGDYTFCFYSSVNNALVEPNAALRDPSAWYHITLAVDTTQATASDRVKWYYNGVLQTSLQNATYPTQNADLQINNTVKQVIGRFEYSSPQSYFDCYLTEVNFVDGQALTPSDFGETNDNGVWSPKEYTGTYGTNGFYLPMKETTQATGFNTVLYTGKRPSQSITGVGFSPDLVWLKSRDLNALHAVFDTVRGANQRLRTNDTVAEDTSVVLPSFDADGFTLGDDYSSNNTGNSFVAWCWDAGSSTVSNTDGTITSSVRANPATGFSVVTYTGNGVAGATVGHGLSSAPKMIILKNRSIVANWHVYHESIGATKGLILNLTNAEATATQFWNNTAPTSSVFSLGTYGGGNGSGNNLVAYCFADVEGFSKFGSYTGNGSTDGPFVYTGFRPAFVLFKNADDSRQWGIVDTSRSTYNQTNATLEPSTSNAENPYDDFDFLSNGFKPRTTDPGSNRSGYTIIYMAFAENPFKNSLAR